MQTKLDAIKLDHDSYIALHVQLHNVLRQLIISRRWQHGERIPGETQLAKHLNISRTTVRIAFQSAEVEGLITRIAGRGTFVSYEASSHNNTRFVGYVTRSFHNEIHRILLSSAETELRSEGYSIIFSNARTNSDEVDVIKQLLNNHVNGLILWANANVTDGQRSILREYRSRNIPIVFIDRLVDGIPADYVGSDNYGGTYALVSHLVELGHRHVVYLTHSIANLYPVDERYRGYRAAMGAYNLPSHDLWKVNSPHTNEFFETDLFQLLDEQNIDITEQIIHLMKTASPRPTAIACVNDALAIMTMRAIRQMGLNVPEDVSVVGFDDISVAAHMDVPLTTASQDAHEIGQRAARVLLERLDGMASPPAHLTVPTRLQIRMSTTTPIEINEPLSNE
ncbi:MAG: GntR family transcriptional regulator [Chloroflexota bacterium]